MKINKAIINIILLSCITSATGCATYTTLESNAGNSPVFFSGTRLDLNAINNNEVAMNKFNTKPPEYPLLDLPASLILDIIVSPGTAVIALTQ